MINKYFNGSCKWPQYFKKRFLYLIHLLKSDIEFIFLNYLQWKEYQGIVFQSSKIHLICSIVILISQISFSI